MDYLNERKVVVKEEPQQSMVDCLIVICLISLRVIKDQEKRMEHSKEYMYDQHLTLHDGRTVMYVDQIAH